MTVFKTAAYHSIPPLRPSEARRLIPSRSNVDSYVVAYESGRAARYHSTH
jgi:hypothetical protein